MRKAYTLIELMIGICIFTLLAGIIIPVINGKVPKLNSPNSGTSSSFFEKTVPQSNSVPVDVERSSQTPRARYFRKFPAATEQDWQYDQMLPAYQ